MFGLRGRRLAVLVSGVALAVGGVAAAAAPAVAASTTIGHIGGTGSNCDSNVDVVQASVTSGPSYTVPAGVWNVTSWSTEAGDGPSASGQLQLEIWRPAGGTNQYMLVGISPVETTTASGTNTFPLATPITVQGGDLLGLRNITLNYGCALFPGPGAVAGGPSATAPAPGEVRTLVPAIASTLNISATLEDVPPVLRVEKVVSGTSATGFVEQVQCTGVAAGSVHAQASPFDASLPFDANGTPDGSSPPAAWTVVNGAWQVADAALTGATCTVTETDTGGAATVSYACSWTAGLSDHLPDVGCPGASSGPSTTPASITFEGNGDLGVVTVTNTFVAPPPAPPPAPPVAAVPVAIAPRFTG